MSSEAGRTKTSSKPIVCGPLAKGAGGERSGGVGGGRQRGRLAQYSKLLSLTAAARLASAVSAETAMRSMKASAMVLAPSTKS